MKKIILSFMTAISLSIASPVDVELFTSTTVVDIVENNETKVDEVFFGEYEDFSQKLSDEFKDSVKGGLVEALFGGLAEGVSGAGLGLIIGAMDSWIMSSKLDKRYLLVEKLEDQNGTVSFKKTMLLIANESENSYSEDELRKIINEKEDA